jgi:TPR repeat protein
MWTAYFCLTLPILIFAADVTGATAQEQRGLTLPHLATPTDDKQLAQVDELLRIGDVAGARLYLEHLLPGGSPAVAFRLAETYDPGRLAAWGVVGVRGDLKKARELYERALAGGIIQAQERLVGLPR